eukprot:TRINITY_DN5541_c0_g1_i2.p1 TRINITY_DN5541_c0_g1~~TRINITY_DN5541_c0_g1_i2.p1  ORF type:complete len:583 (-),score=180.15 TRINITY_DN5541_c0_g1_i2:73-1791(-)
MAEPVSEELSKPCNFQNNIVRIVHADGSRRAYRVPDLETKNVKELLDVLISTPNCPFFEQTDVALFEHYEEEGLLINSSATIPLEGSFLMSFLAGKWAKENKKIELILKKSVSAAPPVIRTSRIEIPTLKRTSTPTHKGRRSNLTKVALENSSQFVNDTNARFTFEGQNQDDFSRPLSQFLTVQSWKEGFNIDSPEIAKIRQHQAVLVSWVNSHLNERGLHISDLHKDIKDGVALINLLEIVSGKNVREYHKKPENMQQKLQNCDLVVQFFKKLNVNVQATAKDVYNGNMTVLFGALYSLIRITKDKNNQRPKKGRRDIVSIQLAKDQNFSIPKGTFSSIAEEDEESSHQTPLSPKSSSMPLSPKSPKPINPLVATLKSNAQRASVRGSIRGSVKAAVYNNPNFQDQLAEEAKKMEQENSKGSDAGNSEILSDIRETTKRLKDMSTQTTRTNPSSTNKPSLVDLTDDQLEDLLKGMGDDSVLSKGDDELLNGLNISSESLKTPQETPTETFSFDFELPHFDFPEEAEAEPDPFENLTLTLNSFDFGSYENDLESLKLDLGDDFVPEDDDWNF